MIPMRHADGQRINYIKQNLNLNSIYKLIFFNLRKRAETRPGLPYYWKDLPRIAIIQNKHAKENRRVESLVLHLLFALN